MFDNFKESVKTRLRQNNVGVAVKNLQTQVDLQAEIQNLLQSIEDLQKRNAKMCKRFKNKLSKYEKELIDMQNIISDF